MNRCLGILTGMSGLLVFFVLNCCCNVSTTYCAVTDPAANWVSARDQITTTDAVALSVPDYVLRDGKLYLQVQVTRPSLVLITSVSFGAWDADKIRQLRRAQPSLEPFWPNPDRPDGGVKWLPAQETRQEQARIPTPTGCCKSFGSAPSCPPLPSGERG